MLIGRCRQAAGIGYENNTTNSVLCSIYVEHLKLFAWAECHTLWSGPGGLGCTVRHLHAFWDGDYL